MLAAHAPIGRSAFYAVNRTALMERTAGKPDVIVGSIDGLIAATHADLATENMRILSKDSIRAPKRESYAAMTQGTFVGGILPARSGTVVPAICPDRTLMVRHRCRRAGRWRVRSTSHLLNLISDMN